MKSNTVLLDGIIVGIYDDHELDNMLDQLATYYVVDKNQFLVTKLNPFGLVN
jgi:hypothetical protein